jgi:multidrug efflux pump subunit AcrB
MPAVMQQFPEVTFDFEGQSRENQKTMDAFGRVLPIILILMFMIVVFTFRSFLQAAIVYMLIPFTLVGIAWGHFVQGYIVSMLSVFGMIALMGIVVNDSLVFVNAMNRLLKSGKKFEDALFEAGISRFRPVLLTSLTTIAGLAPLIFESSHQAQFLSPMAISVAYGLLFGTFLTLLMLPSLLAAFNKVKVRLYSFAGRKKLSAEQVEPAVREDVFAENY